MSKRERKKEIPDFCIKFGQHIRTLRIKNNISIEEIAFKTGIDAQNLRKYELGKQEMKISMMKRIANAFEMTTSELLQFDKL